MGTDGGKMRKLSLNLKHCMSPVVLLPSLIKYTKYKGCAHCAQEVLRAFSSPKTVWVLRRWV